MARLATHCVEQRLQSAMHTHASMAENLEQKWETYALLWEKLNAVTDAATVEHLKATGRLESWMLVKGKHANWTAEREWFEQNYCYVCDAAIPCECAR